MRKLAAILLPLALLATPAHAVTVPGAIPGSVSVTESGAAAYNIPLAIPPGTAGMEPKLSLNYSSQSGNGIAGVGWSLGGLSAVTRCPQTIIQDGQTRGVQLDANDRFCLDGQRLVLTTGATYGAVGAEYRTEIESFSKIVSYGGTAGDPQFFKVWTKAGQIIEFGSTADSRVEAQGKTLAAAWAVKRISDTVGNYINFTYFEDNANGEHFITVIDYTGNTAASVAPYNAVEFQYEARPDDAPSYLAGVLKQETQRLLGIQTKISGVLVADYQLDYETGTTSGRSRLVSLTQCAADGNCLTPTSFAWEEGEAAAAGFETGAVETSLLTGTMADIWFAMGDVNGDGRIDATALKRNPMTFYTAHGEATGFKLPTTTALGWSMIGNTDYGRFYLADYDGDGRSDPAMCFYENADLVGGFVINKAYKISWHALNDGQISNQNKYEEVYKPDPTHPQIALRQWCMPAELNGDGKADTLWYAGTWQQRFLFGQSTADGYNVRVNGSETSGSVTYFYGWPYHRLGAPALNYESVNTATSWFFPVDINGDGRTDAARIDASTGILNLWTTNNDGKSYTTLSTVPMIAGSAPQNRWYVMSDINGDGLADVLLHDPVNGNLSAWLAKGNGAFAARTDTLGFDTGGLLTDTWFMVADLNHDGRADVIKYKPVSGEFKYALSQGDGAFAPAQQINIGAGKKPGEGWFDLADINGDGNADVVRYNPTTGKLSVNFALGATPDRLLSITNGLNATTSITYKPLTDPSVYTKGSGAVYPEQDVQAAMYVVSETAADDGIGGTFRNAYRYAGARTHLTGRGFLGFKVLEQTDLQTGIVTRSEYSQTFPNIGTPLLVTRITADGVELARTENTPASKPLNAGKTTFPYVAYSKEQGKDLNAAVLPSSETWNTYDDWGNLTQTISQTSDGFKKQTDSTYANDATQWHLGRLTRASVASDVNGWVQTRVSAFEYHATTGILTKEIIEPDAANVQYRLDTTYTHDAFGNRTSVTVSSPATGTAAIATRSSTTTFDAKGQFPATTVNALNHSESKTYDARFGTVKTLTGPNALTTTWQYDSFGRKTLETRADGTYTQWTYAACDGGCPAYGVYRVVTQVFAPGGIQAAPVSVSYFDKLNRATRSATQGFDGRWIYKDTKYDNQGRVTQTSRPYYVGDTVYWSRNEYDDLGRVIQTFEPDEPAVAALTVAYNGLVTSRTNRKGQTTSETVNSQGQKVSITDALAKTVTYGYDPFGNLQYVTSGIGQIEATNSYDIRGRKIWGYTPDLRSWLYEYNPLGELVKLTDAKSQITIFQYDLLGRMTRRIEPGMTSNWVYDSAPYGKGKLRNATTSAGYTRTHYYDDKGRSQLVLTNPGAGAPLLYTSTSYDTAGRVAETWYRSGLGIRNVYNAVGYQTETRNVSDGTLYWQLNDTDAEGHITQESLGNGTASYLAYYPANGRFNYRVDNRVGAFINFITYSYDEIGNVGSRYQYAGNRSETYNYDDLNRLTQTTLSGGAAGIEDLTYGAGGNLISKTSVGAYSYGANPNCPAGSNAGTHAVCKAGTNTYSYDLNGNLTGGGGRSIDWTSWNMPVSLTQSGITQSWLYGPEHDRYKMQTSGRTTWYLNPGIHQGAHYEYTQYAGGTVEHRTTIYGGGKPIGEVLTFTVASGSAPAAQTRYFHSDAQGSITAVTNSSGVVITKYRYDSWGKQTLISGSNTGIDATRQGHTGHEMLDGGLTHMNGRLYDPVLSRFVSADPIVQEPFDLQSLNRYSYVLNNPLGYTDPTGFIAYSDGGSWGGGSLFISGGSSSGINFSFGGSGNFGGGGSGGRSNSGGGVSQSSVGQTGVYSNSYSLAGVGTDVSSYARQWNLQGVSSNGGSGVGSWNTGNPSYFGMLNSRSTSDGAGRTMGEILAAQNSSRNLFMGFVPGSGLNDAADSFRQGSVLSGLGMLAMEMPGFKGLKAAGDGVKYIGKLDDLRDIPRSQTLLDDLPNLGSAKANYQQNSSVLRKALRDGYEIRDASAFRPNSSLDPTRLRPDRTVGQSFLGAERNILDNKGLKLSPDGVYLP